MSPRPVIIHITPASGSLFVLLRNRLKFLASKGFEQIALTTNEGRDLDPARELADIDGLRYVESTHLTRDFNLRADAAFFKEVTSLVRSVKPVVTMTYGPKPGAVARPAARLGGSRVIHMHWGNVFEESSPFGKRLAYKAIDFVGGYFSSDVCVENRVDFARLNTSMNPWTRFHLLGNAADIEREFSMSALKRADLERLRSDLVGSGTTVVTIVGRVVVDKGYREFVSAAQALSADQPELGLRFVMVGRRDAARGLGFDIEAALAELSDGTLVDFGHVNHEMLPLIYGASDIVCLPSYREGFPRSLVEAAAMGKPIVASDIPGCREVVEDQTNGLLVPVRDSVALAAAIARLAQDPLLREKYGRASRDISESRFSESALFAKVMSVMDLGPRRLVPSGLRA